jgi:ribose transport system substrate-binding protein
MKLFNPRQMIAAVALTSISLLATVTPVHARDKETGKVKIYLSMSYTGNAWMTHASNIVKALAKTPPYDKLVIFKEVISGVDVQAQNSAYESMIADGADGIITFPISSSGLNRSMKKACDAGVIIFSFANHVTEQCGYSLAYIGAGFGENTAQALVNELNGKGKILLSRGVPGSGVDKRHYDGAMSVFNKYPDIKIVSEYYGMWDDQTTQAETSKALAANPDIDGIWAQAGEFGALKAILASGRDNLPAMTGENSAGFRHALANPEYQKRGLRGVSAGDSPIIAGVSFKLMMEMILNGRKVNTHHMTYPLAWLMAKDVKYCNGDRPDATCNTYPAGKVADSFISESFNNKLVPEISLVSVLEGKPTPGAKISPLPAGELFPPAPSLPGISCNKCELAKNPYVVNKITPLILTK